MKNRIWIIIFSVIIILCAGIWIFISNTATESKLVGIYQNGKLVEKINLELVTEEREIKLTGEFGTNIIVVSHNQIRMKSADCPDKICVNHGELISSASPIVCLPNKIIIKFEDMQNEADAKTGAY